MQISAKRLVLVTAVLALLMALLLEPSVIAPLVSEDGQLSEHSLGELRVLRLIAGALCLVLFVAHRIFTLGERAAWGQAIAADYARWSSPLASVPRDVSLRAAGISIAGSCLAFTPILLSYDHRDTDWYKLIANESGLVETGQAVCLAIAGVLLLRRAVLDLRAPARQSWLPLVGVLLGVGLLLVVGEELSWGQHWLGFATPEELKAINVQREFNFHNVGGYWANHLHALLCLAYFGVLPVLGEVCPEVNYAADRASVPLVPVPYCVLAVLSILTSDYEAIFHLWGDPTWRLSEARELIFGAGMLSTTLLMSAYRRQAAPAPATAAARP